MIRPKCKLFAQFNPLTNFCTVPSHPTCRGQIAIFHTYYRHRTTNPSSVGAPSGVVAPTPGVVKVSAVKPAVACISILIAVLLYLSIGYLFFNSEIFNLLCKKLNIPFLNYRYIREIILFLFLVPYLKLAEFLLSFSSYGKFLVNSSKRVGNCHLALGQGSTNDF